MNKYNYLDTGQTHLPYLSQVTQQLVYDPQMFQPVSSFLYSLPFKSLSIKEIKEELINFSVLSKAKKDYIIRLLDADWNLQLSKIQRAERIYKKQHGKDWHHPYGKKNDNQDEKQ